MLQLPTLRGAAGPSARPSRSRQAAVLLVVALGAGCTTIDEPSFEDVPPADELYAEAVETLENDFFLYVIPRSRTDDAVEVFQSVIDNYPYSEYAVKAELAIADAYFDDERYDEAITYYRDFADLHPDHEAVPYTILRSAQSHFEQISSADRDQTNTREALDYLNRLLSSYPFAPETEEGEQLMRALRGQLARNVMKTGDFYLQRDEYSAAASRYREVINDYPGLGLDPEALYKLGVCYSHMRRRDEALRLFHVVVENYATSDLAVLAREQIAGAD